MSRKTDTYLGYRYPTEIISHAIWLYFHINRAELSHQPLGKKSGAGTTLEFNTVDLSRHTRREAGIQSPGRQASSYPCSLDSCGAFLPRYPDGVNVNSLLADWSGNPPAVHDRGRLCRNDAAILKSTGYAAIIAYCRHQKSLYLSGLTCYAEIFKCVAPFSQGETEVMMSKMWHKNRLRRQKHSISVSVSLLFVACVVAFPLGVAETPLKNASLMPLWEPQAQFAGYYVALDKGIYARHGIDLKILRAGPGHSPAKALEEGATDFAVLWLTTAIQHRAAGIELVNLAQIVQRSSMMLVSKKTAGIKTIADMNGKKVGLWEGDVSIPPRTLFAKHGIKVREVRQSHSVNLFLRGGIDVTSAMWFNEYHTILDSGIDPEELNVMFLRDQGMNFLEDGIYTLEKTLQQDPALAAAFADASLEGWRYAFEHPDEALDIVIKYMREAHLPANRMHQKWMLERMRDLILPVNPQGKLGDLIEQDYQAVGRAMQEHGLIRHYPDYHAFVWRADAGKK